MRISVRKDDPGYHQFAYRCKVHLNGEPIEGCFTADEEAGEAHIHKRDKEGKYIIVGGRVAEEIIKGEVSIIAPSKLRKAFFNGK